MQGEWIQCIAEDKNEKLFFLLSAFDNETQNFTYTIVEMDNAGNELLRNNITKLLNLSENDYINKMLIDNNSNIFLATNYSVYIYDLKKNNVDEMKSDSYINGMAMTTKGNVICAFNVDNDQSSQVNVRVLDIYEKKWKYDYELEVSYLSGVDPLMSGKKYDFYYSDISGIYGFDMTNKESFKVMDFTASGITSDEGYEIMPLSNDSFVRVHTNEDGLLSLFIYKKEDSSTIKDKKIITLGVMYIDDSINKQVIEFNKKNKECQIEIRNYSDYDNPLEKWNLDIMSNNIPDIICLNELPYEQYISKGLLENLTPYFNRDDEVSTEDIIDSVLNTITYKNKEIYYITPSFEIYTLVARKKDVESNTGWTFDEFKDIIEKQDGDVRPFCFESKDDMLSLLLNNLDKYINWDTGECSFDSQEFKDILEISNRGTNNDMYDDIQNRDKLVQDGKVLLIEDWVNAEHIQLYRKLLGDDVTYIGFPDENREGSYFQFGTQLAISSKSKEKDFAWQFIRSFMMKEYQAKNITDQNNPTRQDCFDMIIKGKTTKEPYLDEFGQEIYPIEVTLGYDDYEVDIEPLSQEEVYLYVNLVKNTNKSIKYDINIFNIIAEESKSYFEGKKSLDETVNIIQNRAMIYVNEKR